MDQIRYCPQCGGENNRAAQAKYCSPKCMKDSFNSSVPVQRCQHCTYLLPPDHPPNKKFCNHHCAMRESRSREKAKRVIEQHWPTYSEYLRTDPEELIHMVETIAWKIRHRKSAQNRVKKDQDADT